MENSLFRIIQDVFDASEDHFDDRLKLMDLEGWDSMAHMHFITQLEMEFDVELTGDEIASMLTIGDVRKVLSRHSKSGA